MTHVIGRLSLTLTVALGVVAGLVGCGAESESFFARAQGLQESRILIANVNGTTSSTITMYDLNGKLIRVVSDTTDLGTFPRGLDMLDPFSVLVAEDTPDQLSSINIFTGARTLFYSGALLTGNIYSLVRRNDTTYVIESNNIERINGSSRYPTSGNGWIPTTVGACTISTARSLAFNSDGNLLVSSFGNNRILLYDISDSTPTCLSSNNTFGSNQPIPLLAHSNGNLYFGTQVNDSIYSGPDDLSANPTVFTSGADINNPTALAELPDGTILVAKDGNDTIVKIDSTTGETLDGAFIKNSFTTSVTSILVVDGQ